MRKTILNLFALAIVLLGSTSTYAATEYCQSLLEATDGSALVSFKNVSGNTYAIEFVAQGGMTFTAAFNVNLGVNQSAGAGIAISNAGWVLSTDKTTMTYEFTTASETSVPTNLYATYACFNKSGGTTARDLVEFNLTSYTDIDWTSTCAGGDTRTNSDLTITAPTSASLALEVGDTYTITHTTTSTGAVTYESSNTAVATVSNTGVITVLASGSTTITIAQEADATYREGKKSFTLIASPKAVACDKGFGTYQGTVDLYDWNGNLAGTTACGQVNLYIATIGDDLMYKASVVNGTFEGNTNYFCQLRTWNTEMSSFKENWAVNYTEDQVTRTMDLKANALSGYDAVIPMTSYMCVTSCGARTMNTIMYKRNYINAPTSDVEAPVLGAATITKQEGSTLVTFPAVTSEEVFYLMKDEEHNVQLASMNPSFTIADDGSGITYQYSCYAVDFNGNMSAAQTVKVTMDFDATSNLALNKTCQAGYDADNAASKANDGNVESRWSSKGGENPADAWWYVDLNNIYNLSQIEIVWEGACATDYVIMGSDTYIDPTDETAWAAATVVASSTEEPATKPTVTTFSVKGHARYLRFKANTLKANNYGASIWEFRVFGLSVYDPDAAVDTEAPTMVSATLKTCTYKEASITIEATDNVGVVKYQIVDAANGLDVMAVPNEGVITISDLKAETSYTLSITAFDGAGNVSTPLVMTAFTTPVDPTIPHVAAPVPADVVANVLSFYSDSYTPVVNLWGKKQWAGGSFVENNIDGNNYLWYTNTTWWGWEFGVNEGYNKVGVSTGVDCSAMNYLHIDVWGTEDGTMTVTPIWGGTNLSVEPTVGLATNDQYSTSVEIKANTWSSYNISLDEFTPDSKKHDFSSIFQFKFHELTTTYVAIDNIYFYKTGTTTLVNEPVVKENVTKTIENGQVVIIRDGIRYNVLGATL